MESDAIAQVDAGAHMLDVNAGIPLADEPEILAQAIRLVQSVTDAPISIDSSFHTILLIKSYTELQKLVQVL